MRPPQNSRSSVGPGQRLLGDYFPVVPSSVLPSDSISSTARRISESNLNSNNLSTASYLLSSLLSSSLSLRQTIIHLYFPSFYTSPPFNNPSAPSVQPSRQPPLASVNHPRQNQPTSSYKTYISKVTWSERFVIFFFVSRHSSSIMILRRAQSKLEMVSNFFLGGVGGGFLTCVRSSPVPWQAEILRKYILYQAICLPAASWGTEHQKVFRRLGRRSGWGLAKYDRNLIGSNKQFFARTIDMNNSAL